MFYYHVLLLCFSVLLRPGYTLVKFSEITPTRAGSYCQRTSYTKCKTFNFYRKSAGKCEPAVLGENLVNMTRVLCLMTIFKFLDF